MRVLVDIEYAAEVEEGQLYFRSVFALFRLLFWSQDMLRDPSTPKTGRTTQSTS